MKAAEGCRSPRRWRAIRKQLVLAKLLDCGSPLPLWLNSMVVEAGKNYFFFPCRSASFFSSSSAWRVLRSLTSWRSSCSIASKSTLAVALASSPLRKISRSAILAAYLESSSASFFFWSAVSLTDGLLLPSRSMANSYELFITHCLDTNLHLSIPHSGRISLHDFIGAEITLAALGVE